ncbi:MAG TPA: DNA mismatch repair endonuclease MutL [Chloroflexota bacterium]
MSEAVVVPAYLAQHPAPGTQRPSRIAVLRADVADRIAAGEVIERPASVVRELVDNALDAGAREVSVELRGGGLELIRVSDDGSGLPADQVELAFERHATSKIRSVEDLERLATLGFRGEALPSIAAVAEVTMLTRETDAEAATTLTLRAGRPLKSGRAARQPGTTATVRHLFHNMPARLKFLPAGRSESLLVGALIRRCALARPDVAFSLALDGHPSFRSTGSGSLETAMAEVYGPAVAAALLPLAGPGLVGLISNRSVTRPTKHHLTLVVNRRPVQCRELLAAIEAAYRPLLPRGRHPIATIVLEVPPEEVDPNVHPAKAEVRLLREAELAEALAALVRDALARAPARPTDDEDFSLQPSQYRLPTPRRRLLEAAEPYRAGDEPIAELRVVAQLKQTLILAEGQRGLYLIDQHRAHERIIYHQLLARLETATPEAQALLEPIVLELTPTQAAAVEERLEYLQGLGFDVQRFGKRDYLVRAVPALPDGENVALHLEELLAEAAGEGEGWRDRLLVSLACRAAVRRSRPLTDAAMGKLLTGLAATPTPASCPHGSPLILHFSGDFLERQFGW